MAKSDNPEVTSGSVAAPAPQLRYPLTETLSSGTRLRFIKYSRFNPSDPGTEDGTGSISLPLPVNAPENYSIRTTGTHDMGLWGNVNNANMDKLRGVDSGALGDEVDNMTKLGIPSAMNVLTDKRFISGVLGRLAGRNNEGNIRTFTGVVQNPHTTLLFEGVNLRNITLEWRFSPRSEAESNALKDIFNLIKLRSHPEELLGGIGLGYPDLVYIEFTGKAKEHLPKYDKAFINSINITPDSSGGMSLFKSGAPSSYNVQINATEISIMTRDKIQRDINGNI